MKKTKKFIVGVTITSSLVLSGSGIAVGATQESAAVAVVGGESRATVAQAQLPAAKYSEADVLQFLVFGDGAISTDSPGLAESLGFTQAPEGTDRTGANLFIADYHAAHPVEVARISANLQSGSPVHVDRALQEFATSLNAYAQQVYDIKPTSKDTYATAGSNWAWTATWLAAAAVVAAGAAAVVYGAVAGFHAGVAVTVIYLVYLPEMQGSAPSTIEKDTMVNTIANGLSD
ncbi:hypothetical protein [Marisediminicola senii]|uniref:hypothetical protein n=1 Tax=Marisediminicola senii TaxID=2711233 RepID=UPI0013ED491E|nr:hypothetical protein [Marisediminicola senii]